MDTEDTVVARRWPAESQGDGSYKATQHELWDGGRSGIFGAMPTIIWC